MSRSWSDKRYLVAYSATGLGVGLLVSFGLVWTYVDRYYWRADGSLSTHAFSPDNKVFRTDSSGKVELLDLPERRPLTRSEKAWIGCQESFPIWAAGGVFGFGAGLFHLRVRERLRQRANDPERQSYDDSINSNRPPPVT